MENDKMKYDLTWIVENMDPEWVRQEPELFIELARYMKREMDRRKEIIQNMRRKELLREALNS